MFVGTLAGGLLAEPLAAEAQQPTKIARIGYLALNPAANPQLHGAFRQGLRDLGYVRRLTAGRVGGFVPKLCLTRAHSGSLQRTPTHVAVGSFSFGARQRQRVRVTKTGSVRKVVSCSQLSTNPFAFVHLEGMLDRDKALFGRECMVVRWVSRLARSRPNEPRWCS